MIFFSYARFIHDSLDLLETNESANLFVLLAMIMSNTNSEFISDIPSNALNF